MKDQMLKCRRGQSGLMLFLSLVVMLFIIGLLIFVFALMGGELESADSVSASESATVSQNGITFGTAPTTLTTCSASNQGTVTTITIINASGGQTIPSTNYTEASCIVTGVSGGDEYNGSTANVTYTYTYAGESWNVINDTVGSIGRSTDWFDIFIVIGAMVVLILLVVIIIYAIKGSGLIADGNNAGSGNVGSA